MAENVVPQEKGKQKGFFAKMFLVDTEETNVNKEPITKNVVEPPVVVPQPQPVIYQNTGNIVGVVNQDIYSNLKQILNQCNLPGPDYLELKTAADANKALIQDENLRFQFSYNSLKATAPKLTKKVVIDSIDKYIEFIEKERVVAQNESDETYKSEVTLRQEKIDGLNGEIETTKQEIIKLNEKILSLSQEINTLGGEKLAKETELGIKKKNFDVTIDTIVNELKSDKLKIETLINE
jgi:hypothetical protein